MVYILTGVLIVAKRDHYRETRKRADNRHAPGTKVSSGSNNNGFGDGRRRRRETAQSARRLHAFARGGRGLSGLRKRCVEDVSYSTQGRRRGAKCSRICRNGSRTLGWSWPYNARALKRTSGMAAIVTRWERAWWQPCEDSTRWSFSSGERNLGTTGKAFVA